LPAYSAHGVTKHRTGDSIFLLKRKDLYMIRYNRRV